MVYEMREEKNQNRQGFCEVYGDENIPQVDLPGSKSMPEEFPQRERTESRPIPDDIPRRDGPGGEEE